jgi:hypothetical protein
MHHPADGRMRPSGPRCMHRGQLMLDRDDTAEVV